MIALAGYLLSSNCKTVKSSFTNSEVLIKMLELFLAKFHFKRPSTIMNYIYTLLSPKIKTLYFIDGILFHGSSLCGYGFNSVVLD